MWSLWELGGEVVRGTWSGTAPFKGMAVAPDKVPPGAKTMVCLSLGVFLLTLHAGGKRRLTGPHCPATHCPPQTAQPP